ncbi:MAG: 2-oxoacid:acceptor oxidoreductase family protein [Eubacteriales bacterium]|nr:2-oxoacid:acceptor oxidoreductase family protein [Eubacteriales bacterium]
MNFNRDYFEIRLESIGGLGANLSGKILGELGALYLGLNASNFSSYGSEKRGSPVKSFVRYAKENVPIRLNSPIEVPEILGIFHIGLAGKEGLMAGVSENTSVIINTEKDPDQVRDILKMYAGKLYCIDALKIAMETKSRVNMVMLGAIAKASEFIPLEKLEEVVKDTIGKKYPKALESNINAIKRGYEEFVFKEFMPDGKYEYEVYKEIEREWGYKNAPIGGVNTIFGSTISNDLSASREGYVPIFDKEKCIQCGLCDSTCPDMVFQFVKGEYKGKESMVNLGPDYHHCKGCLRCTEICPTKALTVGLERDADLSKTHIRNQQLILDKLKFEDVGANSYITSETNKEDLNV